jgi:hypothetical protein
MTGADRAHSTRLRFGAGSLLLALGVAIAAAAATQVPAGAGAPAPDKTIPTLPPASGDVPATAVDTTVVATSVTDSSVVDTSVVDTVATESTEVAPASTVAVIETGIPLRAGAGPAELFAAANRALASEGDIAAGLAGFAVMPTGIPTPAGATVNSIYVSYSADIEYVAASAEFTTSAAAEDVVAYYQTVLTSEGFSSTLDGTEQSVRQLEFARSDSESAETVVRLTIDTTDGVTVGIEVTADAEPAALEAFAGWPAGLPGLDEGVPVEALISATRNGSTTVSMSTTFAYDGITVDELTARIRDGLVDGAGGFQVADGDEGGTTITLDHAIINDAVASISDSGGVTQLRVDGSLG